MAWIGGRISVSSTCTRVHKGVLPALLLLLVLRRWLLLMTLLLVLRLLLGCTWSLIGAATAAAADGGRSRAVSRVIRLTLFFVFSKAQLCCQIANPDFAVMGTTDPSAECKQRCLSSRNHAPLLVKCQVRRCHATRATPSRSKSCTTRKKQKGKATKTAVRFS